MNELMSFKPRSLTIQPSHSSFFRFIYAVTFREFEICSRHAIINNLHFHIFINISTLFYDICNISRLDVKAAVSIYKSKHIFLNVMISKKHSSKLSSLNLITISALTPYSLIPHIFCIKIQNKNCHSSKIIIGKQGTYAAKTALTILFV